MGEVITGTMMMVERLRWESSCDMYLSTPASHHLSSLLPYLFSFNSFVFYTLFCVFVFSNTLALAITQLPDFKQTIEAAAEKLQESGNDASKALQRLKNPGSLGPIIRKLAEGLAAFIGYQDDSGKIEENKGIGQRPKNKNGNQDDNGGKPYKYADELRSKLSSSASSGGYYYSYDPAVANWTTNVEQASGGGDPQNKPKEKCAKIFSSCLPIIFSGLSYIYWNCKQQKSEGGWNSLKLNEGNFYKYMVGMDYHRVILTEKRGTEVVSTALKEFRGDFNGAVTSSKSYAEFFTAIYPWSRSGIDSNNHSLSTLYLGASAYFTYKHTKNIAQAKPPTTIREMLYFLSALQFSPHYSYLQKHIDSLIPENEGLPVADSSTSSPDNFITQCQMKGFLHASCLSAPATLGWLQGAGDFNDEPWLYHLFCNGLNLAYPSSSHALFNTLANYTYALQFQLHFLYLMCSTNATVCCWSDCRFGKSVEPQKDEIVVPSHICAAFKCTSESCKHNGSGGCCNHNKHEDGQSCGKGSNQSPLQAFLTDCLQGFCRKHPGTSDHLADHPQGAMCHVPMGFTSNDLRGEPRRSDRIYYTLYFFCGSQHDPLRRLCETLTCLTKRTPRTLGDVFGFIWHLNSQLFKSGVSAEEALKEFMTSIGLSDQKQLSEITPDQFFRAINNKISTLTSQSTQKGIDNSLITLFPGLPFWYNIFMVKSDDSLPVRLFNLKGTDHKPSTYKNRQHNDLFGLYNPQCSEPNCGKYLMPLCFSNGATFAPRHASSYLSWVLYLTDYLQSGFEYLLDDFKNIDCKTSGCRKSPNTQQACQTSHALATHGTSSGSCSCESVVQCGGTLPILYGNGFDFYNVSDLYGWRYNSNKWNQTGTNKRKCHQFASQLTNVLSPKAPLDKLITTIDAFLYAIRWEFFSKLSGFWSIYICLILYTFLFLLDTLHLRSHVKLTSSHVVPPLALLTQGKPLPITKLTYITQ
ncbi:variant erythrocyte surface antigen-1 family protein [Babesia caballi]|uniref:Variant erythrocyte surface antigen-1 family protein n=1 Tax=Babesia caballi TaxID=5871 RepID=A0AAV4M186_BABCB|nr:variant erythrocyte surface antigen-1 family protein [Babesia caballi]